ncbi:phage holin family protein [Glycomyces sp. NPDC046736]|uniref:phage holin family protein n=1 Tax=Glycomyces sp. NPDC046736 TaxID=3155615 RepID=UPI0033CDA384
MRFLMHTLITAAALAFATWILDGIHADADGPARNAFTLIGVALVFGLVNAVLKPLIRKATGCLYVVTVGLAALVVNGLLFLLTEWIASRLGLPFEIDGFWPAFWGAIIVSAVSAILSFAVPNKDHA